MRKPIFSPPDPFSLSPLLSLLPVTGNVAKLPALTTSLYARYEKVKAQHKDSAADHSVAQRYAAEEAMLKQVLDWLAIRPEQGQ